MTLTCGSLFSGTGMLDEGVQSVLGGELSWFTDLGLTRNEELKILGNGVVRQQAAAATRAWVCDMRAERAA